MSASQHAVIECLVLLPSRVLAHDRLKYHTSEYATTRNPPLSLSFQPHALCHLHYSASLSPAQRLRYSPIGGSVLLGRASISWFLTSPCSERAIPQLLSSSRSQTHLSISHQSLSVTLLPKQYSLHPYPHTWIHTPPCRDGAAGSCARAPTS